MTNSNIYYTINLLLTQQRDPIMKKKYIHIFIYIPRIKKNKTNDI